MRSPSAAMWVGVWMLSGNTAVYGSKPLEVIEAPDIDVRSRVPCRPPACVAHRGSEAVLPVVRSPRASAGGCGASCRASQAQCRPASRIELLLPGGLRQHEAVEVGPRDAQQLGLTAVVGPHVGEAVRGAGDLRVGVGDQAEGGEALLAVRAMAARDAER